MKKYQEYLNSILEETPLFNYGVGAKPRGPYAGFDGIAKGDALHGYSFVIGDHKFVYDPKEDIVNIFLFDEPIDADKYEIVDDKHIMAIHRYNIEFYPETKAYKIIKG